MAETHPPLNTITTDLPTEIILVNILPRLPAKSILNFKFVCKQWHSHLSTPSFAKIHLHRRNHHKILVLSLSKSEPFNFCTIDCETPKHSLTPTRLVPFKATYKTMSIVTSFHGMLCVGITKRSQYDVEYSHLILWNPLTGEYKTLSKLGSEKECYKKDESPFGLYYSSSDDDYKLLRVTNYHAAYIYSLKSDSWRKVVVEREAYHDFNNYDWFSYSWEPTALLNDKLYFLKQTCNGNKTPNSYSILMFDTKAEKFRVIAAPCFGDQLTTCLSFMVHRDRIHLCVTIPIRDPLISMDENMELWRMDGDGDWTKVLINYRPLSSLLWSQYPIHLMRNGNWLMYSLYDGVGCSVDELDMETQTTPVLYTNIYIPLRGKYMETIVSPNQYTKKRRSSSAIF